MEKFISLIKVNKNDKDYTESQVNGIKEYVIKNNIELSDSIKVDSTVLNSNADFSKSFHSDCTLLVYDMSVFGRRVTYIVNFMSFLLGKNIKIIIIRQNIKLIDKDDIITKMVLKVMKMSMALERELMGLRTKEALTKRRLNGLALGKPVGTIQKSKFDLKRDKIEELLGLGVSVRKISQILGYNNHIGLNNYVKKRDLREKVKNSKKNKIRN